ncbi:MAG: hypothetical protein DCC55_11320 [Chloroflexi bacterium]|nr:MAG: hypothetical protein DCC55_11320 [Chloroflexota bacterium]
MLIVAPTEYDASVAVAPLRGQVNEMVELVRTFLRPIVLTGRVTEGDIANAVREQQFDAFWFIGHATDTAVALSDKLLPVRALGQYLARAEVDWSYLNTCDSGAFVEQLQAIHAHDVYANIAAINDADATRNGVLLAQGIADAGRVQRAYHIAAAGRASSLRYFPSPNGAVVRDNPDLERRVERLERVVLGDTLLGAPSWLEQSRTIDKRLRRLEWSVALALLVMVVAVVIAFSSSRRPQTTVYVVTPTPTILYPEDWPR